MWPFSGVRWDQVASTVSTKCPSSSATTFPRVAREPPGPHSVPGDSPFPPEHRQVSSCRVADSVLHLFTVFMEFKPCPFSFLLYPFSLVPVVVSNFPLSLQLLLGRGAFPVFSPLSPSSLRTQKPLRALHSFSLPKFTSLCHIPAEFFCLGCADCCINPHISFLGVQDGLVLVWLYFMDVRHTKNFHAVPPSWLLPVSLFIL